MDALCSRGSNRKYERRTAAAFIILAFYEWPFKITTLTPFRPMAVVIIIASLYND
jgi:hypothetical protein